MKGEIFTGSQDDFEAKNKNCEKTEKVSEKWSLRSILIFSLLCAVNFSEFAAYSILTSFFPLEALKMGASKFDVGVIFSAYALVGFISSPFIGLLVPKFGCRVLIMAGLSVLALGQLGFMFATMLPKGAAFVGYTLLFRIISALGAITCDTAAFSLVTHDFPNAVGLTIGLLEVFTGLGLGIGPVIGGYLFTVGGFEGPFIGITCLVVVTIILVYIFIPGADEKGSKENELKLGPLKQALVIVDVLFGAEVTVVTLTLVVALDPILSLFAEPVLHINATMVGVLFAVLSLFYLLATIIAGKMADKTKHYIPLLCVGFLVMAVGYLLIGPAPFLTFVPRGNFWLVVVSMMVIGLGTGSSFIPLMPFLLTAAMDNGMPDNLATSSIISGLFMSSCSFGSFLAPLASSALFQELGFPWTMAIFAFMCFAQVMLMVIYEVCSRIRSRKSQEKGRYQHLGTEEQ